MEVTIAALQTENDTLRTELAAVRAQYASAVAALEGAEGERAEGGVSAEGPSVEASSAGMSGGLHTRSDSVLSSGKVVKIRSDELTAMRSIFELFDGDGDGRISVNDLAALHAKLGEPITADEAADAVRVIGQGADDISFEDLVRGRARAWTRGHCRHTLVRRPLHEVRL